MDWGIGSLFGIGTNWDNLTFHPDGTLKGTRTHHIESEYVSLHISSERELSIWASLYLRLNPTIEIEKISVLDQGPGLSM